MKAGDKVFVDDGIIQGEFTIVAYDPFHAYGRINAIVTGDFPKGLGLKHGSTTWPVDYTDIYEYPNPQKLYWGVNQKHIRLINDADKPPQKESLLEEAKRRYPVGTKYKSNDAIYSITESSVFQDDWVDKDCVGIEYGGWIKYKGKWAEIIDQPKPINDEFKPGDWVKFENKLFRIEKIEGGFIDSDRDIYEFVNNRRVHIYSYNGKKIVRATPEEIESKSGVIKFRTAEPRNHSSITTVKQPEAIYNKTNKNNKIVTL